MNTAPLTYRALHREVRKEVMRHALVRGQSGAVLFLWAVGLTLFWLTGQRGYLGIWTAASVLICALAVICPCRDHRAVATATRAVLRVRYSAEALGESRHRAALQKAIDVYVELSTKVQALHASRGADGDELDVLPQAARLLALQYESARQAKECRRILGLVGAAADARARDPDAPGAERSADFAHSLALHRENAQAIAREVAEAEEVVGIIADQLDTLLLQALRMEQRTIDAATGIETRRKSKAALERLQQTVDARRAASAWLLASLAPNRQANDDSEH